VAINGSSLSIQFSDDEDDTRRVVRSAKEKRYELIHTIMKSIRNSKKIKDFNKMETSFQELTKAFDKAKPVIEKEENGVTPRFYVRILVEMEDLVNETWEDREGRKNMSKINSKSLSTLRQKLRKYIRENFDDDMAKFRENPEADDDEEEVAAEAAAKAGEDGDSDSDSDNEEGKERKKSSSKSREETPGKEKKVKKALGDDDESDEDYWDSDSASSSGSSSEDDAGMSLRDKFLKKVPGDKKKTKERMGQKAREKERKLRQIEEESDEDGEGWKTVDRGALEKPKMFDKDAEINHDLVVKKLHEIMAARGKKRTNRKEQIELLTELFTISEEHALGPAILAKIQFAIVSAIFDYNPKVSVAMKPEYWEKCMPNVEKILQMLQESVEDLDSGENITEEEESYEEKPYKIRGCFLSVVERLDEEFIKVLKGCDAHSNEYVERLKDEPRVVTILETAQKLLESKEAPATDVCRIYLKRIEHIYFKFDPKVIQQKNVSLEVFFTLLYVSLCVMISKVSCSFESLSGLHCPLTERVINRHN
jgi:translation initiation factor 3 subunit C